MQHFDWLIRFQLDDWTHFRIAKQADVKPKTVASGCKSAAELIDLTPAFSRLTPNSQDTL